VHKHRKTSGFDLETIPQFTRNRVFFHGFSALNRAARKSRPADKFPGLLSSPVIGPSDSLPNRRIQFIGRPKKPISMKSQFSSPIASKNYFVRSPNDNSIPDSSRLLSENITGSNHLLSTGFRPDEKMWLSNTSSGLGWGVGAATGAKLAAPDRQVVCNIGDGSVMYSAAGFGTQARYSVPVLTVVCNNRYYQTVRNAYVDYGG
jgi:hypothetical protein